MVELQALVVDYGGVLTSGLGPAMSRWMDDDGVQPEHFRSLMRKWLTPGAVRNPVHDLETGSITGPQFEALLTAALAARGSTVVANGLLARMFADFAHEPDMHDVLRRARADGRKTALLSNSWANDYPREGWDELFDVEVISGEVGLRKPDPEIYRLTARRLDLEPAACVFVDDLRPNVQAAVAVGMVGVLHVDVATTVGELSVLFGWQ